jgi:transcription elongation factor Elf1
MTKDVKEKVEFEEYDDYYGHDFWCWNCGTRNYRYIKKGKALDTVSFKCDNCGCNVEGKKHR